MKPEGWTYLHNAPKWHYFVERRSLCGRWMLWGHNEDLQMNANPSPDNCMACFRKACKRLGAPA